MASLPAKTRNLPNTRVLLINTSYAKAYQDAKVKAAIPCLPPLAMAALAGAAEARGAQAWILDFNVEKHPKQALIQALTGFEPTHVCISFTTNGFGDMQQLCNEVRALDTNTVLIGGGTHTSTFPEETLQNSKLDFAVIGEGDLNFQELIAGKNPAHIPGIAYRDASNTIHVNPQNAYIQNLDVLPYPAWHLVDASKYHVSKLISRQRPVAPLETSRGCLYGCTYCTKSVFGKTWRFKSAARVLREISNLEDAGFREFHVVDDMFSTKMDRAKDICRRMKDQNPEMVFNLRNGIRVNSIDPELAALLSEANCYRASFGVESGNQKVLDGIKKGIKIEEVRTAFRLFREHGIERLGFFMFGLPDDTEQTMQQTIDFALEISPDLAKASICTPFPGTPLYNDFKQRGLLLTEDWDKFMTHNPREVYRHPHLEWDVIYRYYSKFYRAFYLRPSYIAKRLKYDLRHGTLIADIQSFLKTDWS